MLADARTTYGAAMVRRHVGDSPGQMRGLAVRTDAAKAALAKMKEQSAADLNRQLSALGANSASQNSLSSWSSSVR